MAGYEQSSMATESHTMGQTDCHQYRSAIASFQRDLNATYLLPRFSGPLTPRLPVMTILSLPHSL